MEHTAPVTTASNSLPGMLYFSSWVNFSVPCSYQKWEAPDQEGWICVKKMGEDICFMITRLPRPVSFPPPHDRSAPVLPTVRWVDPQVDGHWGDAFVGSRDPVGLCFDLLPDFIKVCKLFGLAMQKLSIFCKGKKDSHNEKKKHSCKCVGSRQPWDRHFASRERISHSCSWNMGSYRFILMTCIWGLRSCRPSPLPDRRVPQVTKLAKIPSSCNNQSHEAFYKSTPCDILWLKKNQINRWMWPAFIPFWWTDKEISACHPERGWYIFDETSAVVSYVRLGPGSWCRTSHAVGHSQKRHKLLS